MGTSLPGTQGRFFDLGTDRFFQNSGPTTASMLPWSRPGNIPSTTTAAVSRVSVIHISQVSCCLTTLLRSKSLPGKKAVTTMGRR